MKSQTAMTPVLWTILIAGCVISLLSFGIRAAFGLFTEPLPIAHGWSRDTYSIAIAIQNLCWGIAQPLAGWISDRRGAKMVIIGGGLIYSAGIIWMAFASTPLELILSAGVLAGLGMGGCSYITVLAALTRVMPVTHRSWVMGVGTAAASLGQFVMVPLAQAIIGSYDWKIGAIVLGIILLVAIQLGWLLGSKSTQETQQVSDTRPASEILLNAFRHRDYRLLLAGFFVCGLQLAFITVHFPPYLADHKISTTIAAYAIGLIGLFNIFGSYTAGILGSKGARQKWLSFLYLSRAAITALFLIIPISNVSVLIYGALMGILWLSTVPFTSGLVAVFFGTRYVATLFGIVFLSHQIGSFLGVWLGGYLYSTSGSYNIAWWVTVGFGIAAGLINLPIREKSAQILEPQHA